MLMFFLFSTEENFVSFLCCFAIVLHLILQSPKMFQLYSTSSVRSLSFPAARSFLVFHVLMLMLSLPRILDGAPVAYLTPPSRCTAEGAVLVDPRGDRTGMICLIPVSYPSGKCRLE